MSKLVFKVEKQIKDCIINAIKTAQEKGVLVEGEIPDFIIE